MLIAGDKFPDFSLLDQDAKHRSLGDLAGKEGLILYVYPKDDTPGCTVEAQDFRGQVEALSAKGYKVAGLSKDSAASHCLFIEKYELNFPLLSDEGDEGGEFLLSIGSFGEKNMYGKMVTGILRSTFVIGRDGVLRRVYRNVKATGHAAKVVRDLG
jgi:thioredoxin-dependent peroxiredoxin